MAEEKQRISKKAKITIAVLLGLLILSAVILAARIIYINHFADKTVTAVVSDNLIGDDLSDEKKGTVEENLNDTDIKNAASIELHKKNPSDNEKFSVYNMLPGDSQVKYFNVLVNHNKSVKVYFDADVTSQTKNLAKALNIKITNLSTENIIYNGSFADINADGYGEIFSKSSNKQTTISFCIEISLPTATDNQYQDAALTADFKWYVKDLDALDSPKTFDESNIAFLAVLTIISVFLIIVLRRKNAK